MKKVRLNRSAGDHRFNFTKIANPKTVGSGYFLLHSILVDLHAVGRGESLNATRFGLGD